MNRAGSGGAGPGPTVLGRATGIVRLLAWAAMSAFLGALVWMLCAGASWAHDPKAEAWPIRTIRAGPRVAR